MEKRLCIRLTEDGPNILKKVKENGGYCPCKLVKTPQTKCMCQEFINETKELKQSQDSEKSIICHCGAYVAYLTDKVEE